ncbi:hypothetical protein AB0K18_30580, partial [Nonomuraea sp. NPDC049421]|uniref:hypothetical protein n=1 Tax=Nonomuraea sp. NPDC049421 TaxID=3155275 RepID=UPI0034488473
VRQNQPFDGWTEVQGGGLTDHSLAAASFGDRLYVFGTGTDKRIYVNSARQNHPFDGWAEVQGGGTTEHPLGAAAFGDRLYAFGAGVRVPAHV